MRAAIAGDIVGSLFERSRWTGRSLVDARCIGFDILDPRADCTGLAALDFPLFPPTARPTDDTALTVALMDWLLHGGDLADHLRRHFHAWPEPADFGKFFVNWANATDGRACGSVGNGAAMRVSPVAFVADDVDTVLALARETALVTHSVDHAVAGAEAIALSVFLARTGHAKEAIARQVSERFGYDLTTPLDAVRDGNPFSSSCVVTVPLALRAVLEADDWEGAVRRAISVGGDSDTIACMAGAVAGTLWGVPRGVADVTLERLAPSCRDVVLAFEARYPAALRYSPT